MDIIQGTIDMSRFGAEEAKRAFLNTWEQINQKGIKLKNEQIDKFNFLLRDFNKGGMGVRQLKECLDFTFNEVVRMAS
jgi:hypothetical protein